ncbi:hypothetical protein BH10PSE12_BH10PSE12_13250 [soil metagenome]
MIKCLFLLYRKPELSAEEFSDYWSQVHSRMAVATAPAMGMKRYVQNHRRDHPIADAFQQGRGCKMGDFDGMAEAWWDDFETMAEAAGRTPAEVGIAILADEARFVDMARSIIWFAEEKPFWPVQDAA